MRITSLTSNAARALRAAALFQIVACTGDDAGENPRDAGMPHATDAAAPCYTTLPLDAYCAQQDSLCGLTLPEAEAALCAGGHAAAGVLERFANSCNGVTLSLRRGDTVDDYHFTGTLDFIGHTGYAGPPATACPLGPSTTHGAPCDRLGAGERVDCAKTL